MTTAFVQLTVNVTASNTWTQLQADGVNYTLDAGKEGAVKSLKALNLGANPATVEFAFSTNGTITDAERVTVPITVPAGGEFLVDNDEINILLAGQGVWGRAVGTSPNVTFRGAVLETQ